MSSAVVDIHYSVERYFNATFGSTYGIAYEGAPFRQDSHAVWMHLTVIGPNGQPSRSVDYAASVRISLRITSRTSQRAVRIVAQVVEDALRAGTITIYDETDKVTVRGYLRIKDPNFQPLPRDGELHAGVLQTDCVVHLD